MDVRRWLREDSHTAFPRRLERDRTIGRGLSEHDPVARVLSWWAEVRPDSGGATLGDRVVAARRVACVVLAVLGLLVGAAVGGVAFGYEGRYPVNLFTLLGVLVGVPLLLLLLTLLLLPGRLPGLGPLQAVAAGMNLGRWMGAGLDRLLGAELFAPGVLGSGSVSAFSRWQLVVFSQWLALGFFAGALAVALLRVTFTDLAFGWSTTLDVDASLVDRLVSTLSAPWAAWLPQAAPDAALVEASRYYRLEEGGMALPRVARLGGWWPFVLMTMLVYGALPRLVLLLVGYWRLRRATVALLLDDPEVSALLDRLDAPLVALGGDGEDDAFVGGEGELPAPREAPSADGLLLMIWNRALEAEAARQWLSDHLGVGAPALAEVGILQNEPQQRAELGRARDELEGRVRRVILITKGWEPPLLEFMDFLGLVREELGEDCSITVVPVDVSGSTVRGEDRSVWSRALTRLEDPRLYVQEALV